MLGARAGIDDEPGPFDYPQRAEEMPKAVPWRPMARDGWCTEPPRPRRAAAAANMAPAARAVIPLLPPGQSFEEMFPDEP